MSYKTCLKFKNPDAGCNIWGDKRLKLAVYLRNNIFNKLNNDWFLENGTLLGAMRNGKFIPHDDDFDIAMLIKSKTEIIDIFKQIKSLLIPKYNARLIDTYSNKIEIYDETYGNYILPGEKYNGHNFHYVTLDIQFYLKKNNTYEHLYFINPNKRLIKENIFIPTTIITVEKEQFNAPNNIDEFLKIIYGNISDTAKYNQLSGLYE